MVRDNESIPKVCIRYDVFISRWINSNQVGLNKGKILASLIINTNLLPFWLGLRRYVIIRIFVSLKICSFLHWVAIYVTKFVIYQYLCNKCWKKKTITYLSFIHRLTKINLPIYDKTNNKKAKGIVSAFLCMTTS